MKTRNTLTIATLLSLLSQAYASNFTFAYSSVRQCGDFNISWSGGTAPYELTIIPSFNRPTTYSIPSSSYSNRHGSYQTQLIANQTDILIAVMSDASGFGSGGVSELITVDGGSSDCNRVLKAVDFSFRAIEDLDQCRTYSFTNYTGAVQPVTITGVIPGGQTFTLNPPMNSTVFDWTADVAAGTWLAFFMVDAQGRMARSTQFDTVGVSGDASCLAGAHPSSVSLHPSQTETATTGSFAVGTVVSTGNAANGGAVVRVSMRAVVAAVIGGCMGLGFVCLRLV